MPTAETNASGQSETAPIEVSAATRWTELQALRGEWMALYDADPNRDYFLSFDWLEECFRLHPGAWSVACARTGGRLVGLLPLSFRTRRSASEKREITICQTGGRLQRAQYAGFLSEPALAEGVGTAFGAHLAAQPFDRLRLENVLTGDMLASLLSAFGEGEFRVRDLSAPPIEGQTDNLVCPQTALDKPFEDWIEGFSKNRRRKFRRSLRNVEPGGEYRIVPSRPDLAMGHLEILLDLWERQWEGVRSPASIASLRLDYWHNLGNPARRGELQVPILLKGDRPICAVGNIMDERNGHLYVIVTGRDTAFADQDIGTMIHLHCIEEALARGVRTYDFCHGNEAYKYSFGCTDRRLAAAEVRRR